MTDGETGDALSSVLSEVMEVVLAVKQAHRKVPEADGLHAVLDQLFSDLGSWAQMLVEEDEALGVAPLGHIASAAPRSSATLWVGKPTDSEVRRTLAEYLERLRLHVVAAMEQAPGAEAQAVLATVHDGLVSQLGSLAEP